MLRTLPPFCGMKALVAAAWVISQVPWTLRSITVRKPFGVIASAGLRNWPPALLTSTSIRPWRSRTPSMKPPTASSSRMSSASNSALPPLADTSSAIPSSGSLRRPQPITVAPRAASSIAVALPKPVPAPETTQTCPSSNPGAKMREFLRSAMTAEHMLARVKVNAEPTPLTEPLAHGNEGATVVIEPLSTGEALWPATFFEAKGRGPIARMRAVGIGSSPESWESQPVPVYLVRHPSLGTVLIDTGLHPSVARNPRDNLGRFSGRHYRVEEGRDLVSQLRERGLAPSDIAFVVLTHLHEDHASGIEAFPNSQFVLSATEWKGATT